MSRRELSFVALIAGLVFAVIGISFLLDWLDVVSLPLGVLGPGALVAIGIAALIDGSRAATTRSGDATK